MLNKTLEKWEEKTLEEICEKISAGGDKPEIFSETKTIECNIPIYSNGIKDNGLYGYIAQLSLYCSIFMRCCTLFIIGKSHILSDLTWLLSMNSVALASRMLSNNAAASSRVPWNSPPAALR